jgi:hypothetical protein
MSFGDLITSSRGPGVIGLLLAMLVLVGFGSLSLMAADDHPDAKRQPVSVRIALLRSEVMQLREQLKQEETLLDELRRKRSSLDEILSKGLSLRAQTDGARKEIQAAEEEIASLDSEFRSYKKMYRERVRDKAKGMKLGRVETIDGTVFEDVEIRQADRLGLNVRHRDGIRRILYEDLPENLREYFGYDPEDSYVAQQEELKVELDYDRQIREAEANDEKELAQTKEKDRKEYFRKVERTLSVKKVQASEVERRCRELEEEIRRDEAKAESMRSSTYRVYHSTGGSSTYRYGGSGRIGGVSRAPILRQELQLKQSQLVRLKQQIAILEAESKEYRRKR